MVNENLGEVKRFCYSTAQTFQTRYWYLNRFRIILLISVWRYWKLDRSTTLLNGCLCHIQKGSAYPACSRSVIFKMSSIYVYLNNRWEESKLFDRGGSIKCFVLFAIHVYFYLFFLFWREGSYLHLIFN